MCWMSSIATWSRAELILRLIDEISMEPPSHMYLPFVFRGFTSLPGTSAVSRPLTPSISAQTGTNWKRVGTTMRLLVLVNCSRVLATPNGHQPHRYDARSPRQRWRWLNGLDTIWQTRNRFDMKHCAYTVTNVQRCSTYSSWSIIWSFLKVYISTIIHSTMKNVLWISLVLGISLIEAKYATCAVKTSKRAH